MWFGWDLAWDSERKIHIDDDDVEDEDDDDNDVHCNDEDEDEDDSGDDYDFSAIICITSNDILFSTKYLQIKKRDFVQGIIYCSLYNCCHFLEPGKLVNLVLNLSNTFTNIPGTISRDFLITT